MNMTPTSDPGSVAIRIARSNRRPILKPLIHIRKDGHTWLDDANEVTYLNMIYPG